MNEEFNSFGFSDANLKQAGRFIRADQHREVIKLEDSQRVSVGVHHWFLRSTDFNDLDRTVIADVQTSLNDLPGRTHKFRTPASLERQKAESPDRQPLMTTKPVTTASEKSQPRS